MKSNNIFNSSSVLIIYFIKNFYYLFFLFINQIYMEFKKVSSGKNTQTTSI